MSVQRTVNMSDEFWQRIIDAAEFEMGDEEISNELTRARVWIKSIIKDHVLHAEKEKARRVAQIKPVSDNDFLIG